MFHGMEQHSREAKGLVVGRPGAGLSGSPAWAVNGQVVHIGRQGELRTASVLDAAAQRHGFTVLHDLHIPLPGITANVDHVVVSGRRVLLIDAKVWRPGTYWTIAGHVDRRHEPHGTGGPRHIVGRRAPSRSIHGRRRFS